MTTATLLPNGKQQFEDQNGAPLVGGSVYFYIPSTTTPKDTWQDPGQTILNTNPIILDARGQAIIYGVGQYRQVVNDANGNLIWDQLTSDTTTNLTSPTITDPTLINPTIIGGTATNTDITGGTMTGTTITGVTISNSSGTNISLSGSSIANSAIIGAYEPVYNLGNVSGAITLDYNNGHVHTATLVGNITGVTIANWPATGNEGYLTLYCTQDATGGRTLTLSSAYYTKGNSTITLSTAPNSLDEVIFRTNNAGTTILTDINANYL